MSDSTRRFLREAALFVLPIAGAAGLLEARLTRVPNSYSYKQNLLDDGRDRIEAVVVGSSHEFEGVNTDLFPLSTVNLALPSQDIVLSSDLARKQIGRLPRLHHILLGVSYYSLAYRLSDAGERWRIGFYMRALDVFSESTALDIVNPANYSYIGIYGPATVQTMMRTGFTADYVGVMSRTGYHGDGSEPPPLPPDVRPVSFSQSAADRAQFHHITARPANVQANLESIRRLARACAARGVRLVLFTSPVTLEYAQAFGEAEWRGYRALLEQLAREPQIRYVDYSRDPAFTWSDFTNADHLNPRGAARFGRLLASELAR